jgi:hypothetical protein
MSDEFERGLREHLNREAQQTSRFPDPLRERIQDAIAPRRFGMMQQLALAGALVVFVGLLAVGVMQLRGFQGLNTQPATTPTPAATVTAQPSPSASLGTTPSATASAFACTSASSSGGGAAGSNLTDVRTGNHTTYDRITFQFDGGMPAYTITPQGNTQFIMDGSGQTVVLAGSSGLSIVFHDSSGAGYSHASGKATYTGSTDLKPNLPAVKEVRQIGDFERTLKWGVGISGPACYKVSELTGPTRLVIDVQTPAGG